MKEPLQTVVFLVRHGETDFAYVSDKNIDATRVLTEKGISQCQRNGQYLADFAPVAIYASPLKRTVQSAQEIKRSTGMTAKVITDDNLLEVYDNARWEAVNKNIPAFFEEIIDKHAGSQVICVTHLDVAVGALRALGAARMEIASICQMGEMYRLVFAGKTFVQATKLMPGNSN